MGEKRPVERPAFSFQAGREGVGLNVIATPFMQ
jgi:hypothetical protein